MATLPMVRLNKDIKFHPHFLGESLKKEINAPMKLITKENAAKNKVGI